MEYALFAIILVLMVAAFCAAYPSQWRNCFVAGVLIAPLGPVSEIWFLRDYWQRPTLLGIPLSVEDLVFSFAIGALSICLPFFLLGISLDLQFNTVRKKRCMAASIVIIACMFIGTNLLGVNSIFASTIAFWIIALYALVREQVPLSVMLTGGIATTTYLYVGYFLLELAFPGVVLEWCTGCNPTGIRLGILNFEELLWDFSWGVAAATIPYLFFREAVHVGSRVGSAAAGLQEH
jgi:hypothetical protein